MAIRIVNASLKRMSKKLSNSLSNNSSSFSIRTLSHSFLQILTFFCKFQNFSVFLAFHRLILSRGGVLLNPEKKMAIRIVNASLKRMSKKRALSTMKSSFYDFSATDLSGAEMKIGDLCEGKPVRRRSPERERERKKTFQHKQTLVVNVATL